MKRKWILAAVLSLSLCFLAAGCWKGSSDNTNEDGSSWSDENVDENGWV